MTLDEIAVQTIGLTARWLFLPKTKRRGASVPLTHGRFDHAAIFAAASMLARAKSSTQAEVETHEIEGNA